MTQPGEACVWALWAIMTGLTNGKECELGGLECSHKPDTRVGWGPHKNTLIGISTLANFWTAQWMNCLPGSNQYFSHNWSSTWQAKTFYRHTFVNPCWDYFWEQLYESVVLCRGLLAGWRGLSMFCSMSQKTENHDPKVGWAESSLHYPESETWPAADNQTSTKSAHT